MSGQHASGPWDSQPDYDETTGERGQATALANGRVLAAAPELLAALKDLLAWVYEYRQGLRLAKASDAELLHRAAIPHPYGSTTAQRNRAIVAARAAIAKATEEGIPA